MAQNNHNIGHLGHLGLFRVLLMKGAFLPQDSYYSPIGNGIELMLILKWPKKG